MAAEIIPYPVQLFNGTTHKPLTEHEFRPTIILPDASTTQVKCAKCKEITEQVFLVLVPSNKHQQAAPTNVYTCTVCGTIKTSKA